MGPKSCQCLCSFVPSPAISLSLSFSRPPIYLFVYVEGGMVRKKYILSAIRLPLWMVGYGKCHVLPKIMNPFSSVAGWMVGWNRIWSSFRRSVCLCGCRDGRIGPERKYLLRDLSVSVSGWRCLFSADGWLGGNVVAREVAVKAMGGAFPKGDPSS